MAERIVYGFMHIPKTGGSTINRQLRNHLDNEEYVHFRREGKRPRSNVDLFADLPAWKRARTRVMAGHYLRSDAHLLVPDAEPRYFTIVRDPADRVLSVFNFQRHRGIIEGPFERWLDQYKTDVAYNLFCWAHHLERGTDSTARRAREALGGMWFVGVTEKLDGDLPYLFRVLGVPTVWKNQRVASGGGKVAAASEVPRDERWKVGNPVERRVEMTDEIRREVHARNPMDLALYRWAKRARRRSLRRLRRAAAGMSQ